MPKRSREAERGSVAVIVAASMVAVAGLTALGTDVGRLFIEKQRLATIADAAALAGAAKLPDDPNGALAALNSALRKNGIDPATAQVALSSDHRQVRVAMTRQVNMTFARVLGIKQSPVAAGATAATAFISGTNGAVPLGVPRADWQVGDQVHLKMDADSGTISPGNYQALALGKNGSSTYEANLMYGYPNWIRIDDWVDTEPGNMAGPTARAVRYRISRDPYSTWTTVQRQSPRLVTVPILQDFNVNGKGQVHVIGFGIFFLEDGIDKGSNKGEIIGRFVRLVSEGETSATAPDFGLRAIKLIQ